MIEKEALGEEDTREVADLLIDQIEFCDVLILNKCDLVPDEDLIHLERVLKNPSAGRKADSNGERAS
ncbi:hypothetical protein GCM10020331_007680 [Ectobacillus funiculus]